LTGDIQLKENLKKFVLKEKILTVEERLGSSARLRSTRLRFQRRKKSGLCTIYDILHGRNARSGLLKAFLFFSRWIGACIEDSFNFNGF
jgi:hypothetical protein